MAVETTPPAEDSPDTATTKVHSIKIGTADGPPQQQQQPPPHQLPVPGKHSLCGQRVDTCCSSSMELALLQRTTEDVQQGLSAYLSHWATELSALRLALKGAGVWGFLLSSYL